MVGRPSLCFVDRKRGSAARPCPRRVEGVSTRLAAVMMRAHPPPPRVYTFAVQRVELTADLDEQRQV